MHPSLAFEWVNYTLSMIICQYNAKVLILATGVLKFTVAKIIVLLYNSSMKFEKDSNMTALTRYDTMELILDHADNQGLTDESYIEFLNGLTDEQLDAELSRLEELAP